MNEHVLQCRAGSEYLHLQYMVMRCLKDCAGQDVVCQKNLVFDSNCLQLFIHLIWKKKNHNLKNKPHTIFILKLKSMSTVKQTETLKKAKHVPHFSLYSQTFHYKFNFVWIVDVLLHKCINYKWCLLWEPSFFV